MVTYFNPDDKTPQETNPAKMDVYSEYMDASSLLNQACSAALKMNKALHGKPAGDFIKTIRDNVRNLTDGDTGYLQFRVDVHLEPVMGGICLDGHEIVEKEKAAKLRQEQRDRLSKQPTSDVVPAQSPDAMREFKSVPPEKREAWTKHAIGLLKSLDAINTAAICYRKDTKEHPEAAECPEAVQEFLDTYGKMHKRLCMIEINQFGQTIIDPPGSIFNLITLTKEEQMAIDAEKHANRMKPFTSHADRQDDNNMPGHPSGRGAA